MSFDKRGRDLLVANWRPENQLQLLDYSTGKVYQEFDPKISQSYLTSAKFVDKDYIVACGTNRGMVRVFDRVKGSILATITEMPAVYDLDIMKKTHQRQETTALTSTATAPSCNFLIGCNTNIVTLEFMK